MRAITKTVAVLAGLGLIMGLLGSLAQVSATESIKERMGDNFQNVQMILTNLVTANYADVPREIEVIREHAVSLTKDIPSEITREAEQEVFRTYAYQLVNSTTNMLTVLEELRSRDAQRPAGEMGVDYLRVVAASQFGEIVTSCVLCHNQFRQHVMQ